MILFPNVHARLVISGICLIWLSNVNFLYFRFSGLWLADLVLNLCVILFGGNSHTKIYKKTTINDEEKNNLMTVVAKLFVLCAYRGYFPKGGGEVRCSCQPIRQLQAIELIDRGPTVAIRGQAFVAGHLPIKVCFFKRTDTCV
jgi:hypothetical protein